MNTATIAIKVEGGDELRELARRISSSLAPGALAKRTVKIAAEAGKLMKIASVRACIEAIYDHPNYPSISSVTPSDTGGEYGGNPADREGDLLDAHQLIEEDGGFTQIVQIDPAAQVSSDAHEGRELVIDYARYVHDGYVQFVHGNNTGVFHEGRFWFRIAELELFGSNNVGGVVFAFIAVAYNEAITEAWIAA